MNKNDKKFIERIRSKITKAMSDFALINNGDTIVVGVSGGKDSMALLDILANRRKSYPKKYNIVAVHIRLTDIPYYTDNTYLKDFCTSRKIDFQLITDDSDIIEEGKQPCFYCAWNRRKLIFQFAADNNYQRVALGHHRDDAVETLLMNMIQHGEMSSFPVKLSMFDGVFDLIRPLIYTTNKELERYINIIGYKPLPYDCEYAQTNRRESIKELLYHFYQINPNATKNIFKAMTNIDERYLPTKTKKG